MSDILERLAIMRRKHCLGPYDSTLKEAMAEIERLQGELDKASLFARADCCDKAELLKDNERLRCELLEG